MHASLILLSLVLLMLGSACAEGGIDYSDPYNWAYYGIGEGKDADLFLICQKDEYLMSITDEENRASFLGALNMERGIYEDSARLFAPYYRQATMKASSLPAEEWDHWTEEAFRDVTDTFVYPAGRRAFSINPLNWKTDSTPADKAENLGACFTDYSGNIRREVPQLCGCYLDMPRGTLKVTDVDKADYPPVVPGLPEGAYHVYDYQFFFRNLQENVMLRLQTYLSTQSEADAA